MKLFEHIKVKIPFLSIFHASRLCSEAHVSQLSYLSMYKICPSGFILSSTLGTVTYWNSPSLALGK